MKKILSVFFVFLITACIVTALPAFSADTDFVVEDGVLLSYTGTQTDIVIPSSVRVISDSVFEGNTKIESVKFHSDLYSIGNRAFYGCTSLGEVISHDSVEHVGALAFAKTKFIAKEDEFITVGSALVRCNSTASDVVLPDYIESVSAYAFMRNNSIKSFTAGANLKSIDEGAFYECKSLNTVMVEDSLYFVGADAFYATPWLASKGDFAVVGNGVLVKYSGVDTVVEIPENVRFIAPNTFYKNTSISKVKIPSTVYSVGERAFMGCSSLDDVTFSNGLVMIDDEAFAQCKSLTSIKTPTSLSKIGVGAFIECTGLEIVYLQGESLSVDYGAFAYCTSLESALLSRDVNAVSDDAFTNCASLKVVTVPDEVIMISPETFTGCKNLTVICNNDSFAHSSLANSVSTTPNRGDVKTDGEIDVMDATSIQRYIASMESFTASQIAYGDADFDTTVSIMDATYVQRFIAKLL